MPPLTMFGRWNTPLGPTFCAASSRIANILLAPHATRRSAPWRRGPGPAQRGHWRTAQSAARPPTAYPVQSPRQPAHRLTTPPRFHPRAVPCLPRPCVVAGRGEHAREHSLSPGAGRMPGNTASSVDGRRLLAPASRPAPPCAQEPPLRPLCRRRPGTAAPRRTPPPRQRARVAAAPWWHAARISRPPRACTHTHTRRTQPDVRCVPASARAGRPRAGQACSMPGWLFSLFRGPGWKGWSRAEDHPIPRP